MAEAHVACAALTMCHHHYLMNAQFVDCHDEAAHSRVEGRENESAGILDDFSIAVLQGESSGKQLSKTRIHAGKHCQFLARVLVGNEGFITLLLYERAVVIDNTVYHNKY